MGIKVAEVVGEITKVDPGESVINVEERINEISELPELSGGKLKQAFDEISKAGDAGLPAIDIFLKQSLDRFFDNRSTTLRRELLKVCVRIKSSKAEKVLLRVLGVTAVAEEMSIIASGLHKISPDKYTVAVLGACKAILNSPPEGFTKEQRSLLEAILAKQSAKPEPNTPKAKPTKFTPEMVRAAMEAALKKSPNLGSKAVRVRLLASWGDRWRSDEINRAISEGKTDFKGLKLDEITFVSGVEKTYNIPNHSLKNKMIEGLRKAGLPEE